MYCKKCGKEINDYTRFCASCGTPVGSTGNKVNAGNPFLNNSRPTTNNSYSSGRVSYISPLALIVAISTIVAAFIGTIGGRVQKIRSAAPWLSRIGGQY